MQATKEKMVRDMAEWCGCAPLHDAMTFTQAGLVLGRGTVLAPCNVDTDGGSVKNQPIGFDEPRIIALLSGAFGRPIAGGVIEKMRRAGDKSLAQIHLALTGLPRIGEWDAYRLHLAQKLLNRGLRPAELMKIMGFDEEARELEKTYDPDQPRVPAGSGAESGRWTSGSGGAGQRTFVRRVDVNVIGATRSDATPPGIVPGAQYAQANPAPVISEQVMEKILRIHGPDASIKKGSFNAEYANPAAIGDLIRQAWEQATSGDVAPSYEDRVIIAGAVFVLDRETGAKVPYPIGRSAELNTPSIETNAYIVILDQENNVINCYPINPADPINPRAE